MKNNWFPIFWKFKILSRGLQFKPLKINSQKQEKYNPSQVQDYQANKRTYLAWMRSAIALMGFGVAEERLRRLQPHLLASSDNGWKLGLLFCLVGLVTVLLSTLHYFAVRRDINADTYQPPDRLVVLFSLTLIILGVWVIYFIFTVPTIPLISMIPL